MHALDSHVVALLVDSSSIGILRLNSAGHTVSSTRVPLHGVKLPLTNAWQGMQSGMVLAVARNDNTNRGALTWIDPSNGRVKYTQIVDMQSASVCRARPRFVQIF